MSAPDSPGMSEPLSPSEITEVLNMHLHRLSTQCEKLHELTKAVAAVKKKNTALAASNKKLDGRVNWMQEEAKRARERWDNELGERYEDLETRLDEWRVRQGNLDRKVSAGLADLETRDARLAERLRRQASRVTAASASAASPAVPQGRLPVGYS